MTEAVDLDRIALAAEGFQCGGEIRLLQHLAVSGLYDRYDEPVLAVFQAEPRSVKSCGPEVAVSRELFLLIVLFHFSNSFVVLFVVLTTKVTDRDGDDVEASINIGANMVFHDDGPSIEVNESDEAVAMVD